MTKAVATWMMTLSLLAAAPLNAAGAGETPKPAETKSKSKSSSRDKAKAKSKPNSAPSKPALEAPETKPETQPEPPEVGKPTEPASAVPAPAVENQDQAEPAASATKGGPDTTPAPGTVGALDEGKTASPADSAPPPSKGPASEPVPASSAGLGEPKAADASPATNAVATAEAKGGVKPADAAGAAVIVNSATERPVTSDPGKELRSNDRLRFRIAEDPAKLPTPLIIQVSSLGEASFPVTRKSDIRITLSVRGKTLGQVREELVKRLIEDYYHRATVELGVEEEADAVGKAQFFGEMGGTIPISPDHPIKLSEAILQLRAPDSANLRRVKVHRVDPVSKRTTVLEINVDAINREGKRDQDIVLQDGDRIEVRQKIFN